MKKLFSILTMILVLAGGQAFAAGAQKFGRSPQEQGGTQGNNGDSGRTSPEIIKAVADLILGKNVKNYQGQDLGLVGALATINDKPVYIIIVQNGGNKLIPIPFGSSRFDARQDVVVLDIDQSTLSQAPTITPDELEKLNDPEFQSQVHSYYGQESDTQSAPSENENSSFPAKPGLSGLPKPV